MLYTQISAVILLSFLSCRIYFYVKNLIKFLQQNIREIKFETLTRKKKNMKKKSSYVQTFWSNTWMKKHKIETICEISFSLKWIWKRPYLCIFFLSLFSCVFFFFFNCLGFTTTWTLSIKELRGKIFKLRLVQQNGLCGLLLSEITFKSWTTSCKL